MKLLFWAVIGFLIVIWLLRGKHHAADASGQRGPRKTGETESMVQCAHCGMHVPSSESVVAPTGTVFCGEEHRLRHER